MRKFNVRWWVTDPQEKMRRAEENLTGECGISIRYHRDATDQEVELYLFFLELSTLSEMP